MVKVHDGSIVPASELLSNNGEDDEGNKLEFKAVKEAAYPTYEAKSKVPDDTGRKRIYRFSFEDTNVTVHMTTTEEEKEETKEQKEAAKEEKKEQKATEKAAKEVNPVAEAAQAKKNSSQEQQQEKLSPPDYRLKKASPA